MRAMRVLKAIVAGLGGGVVFQAAACDTTTITTELVNALAPTLINIALSALLGGAGF